MSREEAQAYIEKKKFRYEQKANKLTDVAAGIKAHIKLVLHTIQEVIVLMIVDEFVIFSIYKIFSMNYKRLSLE